MTSTPQKSFDRSLFDEQMRLVVSSPTRLWGPLAWLAVTFSMRWFDEAPASRALMPVALAYSAYSIGLWTVRRVSARPPLLPYAIPFVDVPAMGVIGLVWAHATPSNSVWAFAATISLCLVFISLGGILLHARALLASAGTSTLVVVLMSAYTAQPLSRVALALVLVALATAAGRSVVLQAVTFVRRAWELADARVREVEQQSREVAALNEELRRQVAERSRELTDALARSPGNVAPAALAVGDVFDGRYRVTRPLGKGGMGAVYEVERERDAQRLALKVVTNELSGRAAARFAREAEIGARVRHENLVSIVDVGIVAGGTPFLVMELVQGGSLEEHRKRFGDPRWALPLVKQIAAGLAELHAHRIVHRDLKPGNVLLVDGDPSAAVHAKISDFGISRFGAVDDDGDPGERASEPIPATPDASLTQTGALMGTPLYMPPEALLGPVRHPSADVFSLGILAYEVLAGRAPFATPPVLLTRARRPLPELAPLEGLRPEVADLVRACLRFEPAERPRARDLADRL